MRNNDITRSMKPPLLPQSSDFSELRNGLHKLRAPSKQSMDSLVSRSDDSVVKRENLNKSLPFRARFQPRVSKWLVARLHNNGHHGGRIAVIFAMMSGLVLGGLTYKIILDKTVSHPIAAGVSGAVAIVVFGAFFGSVRLRCTIALLLPNLLGAQGRTAILSLITVIILDAPLHSITANVREVGRAIPCGAEALKNQSDLLKAGFSNLIQSALYSLTEDFRNSRVVTHRPQNPGNKSNSADSTVMNNRRSYNDTQTLTEAVKLAILAILTNNLAILDIGVAVVRYLLLLPILLMPLETFWWLRNYLKKRRRVFELGGEWVKQQHCNKRLNGWKKFIRALRGSVISVAVHMILTLLVVAVDFLLYLIQNAVQQGGEATLVLAVPVEAPFSVIGPASVLTDPLFKALKNASFEVTFSTTPCLPRPIPPGSERVFPWVAGLYLVAFIISILAFYSKPLRAKVVEFFLPFDNV